MSMVHEAVRSAFAAGLMPLPTMDDGSKRPAVASWAQFKTTRATREEMRAWRWSQHSGFGVIAGAVSNYTECWDFDSREIFDAFCEAARELGLGEVLDRILAGYSDATPRDGRRILVHYPPEVTWQDCTLARRPGENGKTETLIELPTFAIVAPSNGKTHPSGKAYRRLSGDFSTIASYTLGERAELLRLARSFDAMPTREPRREPSAGPSSSRPGDIYASRTSWAEILEPAGWRPVHSRGDVTYWRRPGKEDGQSATTNHGGSDLLFVFSSSTPFEPEKSYTKFAAYAQLEHRGDFSAAAKALAARGFGEARSSAGRPADSQGASTPVLVRLSDVATEEIDWLWEKRLARGKKTLIAGDPGIGKSTLTTDIGARITVSGPWPDGGHTRAGNVLFLSAEDGVSDTIKPRIERCGGDPRRVFILQGVTDASGPRLVNLARDLAAVQAAIDQVKPELVIIDPITAYLGRTDAYKDAEVRGLLAPLLAALVKYRCALLTVAHLSKDQQRAALHRPGGSIAFVAAARLAFVVAADPNDEDRRIVATLKSNICRKASSLAFRLPDGRVEWESESVDFDAETLLQPAPTNGEREEQVDAETFLQDYLADGSHLSSDILKAAEQNGISRRTLFRVKARLGVRAIRTGGVGAQGRWIWRLTVPDDLLSVPDPTVGTLNTLSTLRPVTVPNVSKSANQVGSVRTEDDSESF